MKKLLVIALCATVLFSCKKSDTGSSSTPVTLKSIIIHTSGQSSVDTITFTYDDQQRLAQYHEAAIDTTQGTSSYGYDDFNFIYNGTGKQPIEYAYYNNFGGIATVDLLSYDATGNLSIDSAIGYGYMQLSNNNNIIVSNQYSAGTAYGPSDSLSIDANGNVSQWAEDTVLDPTVTPTVFSRNYLVTYSSYSTNTNPLYNFNTVGAVLFNYGSLGLEPYFFYSKQLPSAESFAGQSVTYQYVMKGSSVQQMTETYSSGSIIYTFNY